MVIYRLEQEVNHTSFGNTHLFLVDSETLVFGNKQMMNKWVDDEQFLKILLSMLGQNYYKQIT